MNSGHITVIILDICSRKYRVQIESDAYSFRDSVAEQGRLQDRELRGEKDCFRSFNVVFRANSIQGAIWWAIRRIDTTKASTEPFYAGR